MQETATSVLSWLFAAYLAATGIYIVSQNRRPSETFAWMLLFATLPGLGVLIYVLFGRRSKSFGRTRTLVQQDPTARLGRLLAPFLGQHEAFLHRMEERGDGGAALARQVRNATNSMVTTENRLEILQNADAAYPALIADMEAARHSIHLQYFSWGSDEFGEKLKALLTAKAADGVEVRILYDPVGSLLMLKRRYIRAMRAGGVRMAPVSNLWRLHTISYRNHRKIAVLDGRVAHTGGLNIGCEHLRPSRGFSIWRDTNLRVEGAAASVLQGVFAVDWLNATGEDLLGTRYFPTTSVATGGAGLPVQITPSGPDSEWRAIRQLYFDMIVRARRNVYLQSPFFILDPTIAEALKSAALAGVDVRVMVSERGTGQYVPYWAANTYMQEIADSGAKILLYKGGYLHAKTASTDGRICSIGSANIDIRSFSINYELNAIIYDEGTAKELEAAFLRDMEKCEAFTVEKYRRRSRLVRLRDSLARLFSPLL